MAYAPFSFTSLETCPYSLRAYGIRPFLFLPDVALPYYMGLHKARTPRTKSEFAAVALRAEQTTLATGDRILGVDPGTAVTGWGLLELTRKGVMFINAGVIRTKPSDPHESRLLQLSQGLQTVIAEYSPNVAAVEEPFFGENARSALILGQARGALLLTIAQANVPVFSYSPREVKQSATGSGSATKEQVSFMMGRILNLPDTTRTPNPETRAPFPLDATDALAIAFCHSLHNRTHP
ncbi:MAG: crossover junction endodeoxyribonuclease RuvC [bacterium]|nr:crossover junction endodeoxyribonuclease RuvC [bacterium]